LIFRNGQERDLIGKGHYYRDTVILALKKWHPYFDSLKEVSEVAPIWVELPYMPLEL
jgi:hypothetical protein